DSLLCLVDQLKIEMLSLIEKSVGVIATSYWYSQLTMVLAGGLKFPRPVPSVVEICCLMWRIYQIFFRGLFAYYLLEDYMLYLLGE
ncbi:16490_t:CDS:2, partial [Gigaspora rosea]